MEIRVEEHDTHVVLTVTGGELFDRDDWERCLGSQWQEMGLLPGQMPHEYVPLRDQVRRSEQWIFKKGGY